MYINTQTNQYPFSERDIRNLNPNTSFQSPFVAPEEYTTVFPAPQPTYNPVTQTVREIAPVLTPKDHYEQQWEVVPRFVEYTDENNVLHTVAEQEAIAIALDLQTKRNSKWEAIKTERDKRTQQGGYKVGTKWYHSDTFSRSQQLGLLIMGNNIPQGLMWKTMDGSFVGMTPALAQGIFQSAALSDSNVFAYAETLNQQVQSSDNPETVDIYSGWPECYLDVV